MIYQELIKLLQIIHLIDSKQAMVVNMETHIMLILIIINNRDINSGYEDNINNNYGKDRPIGNINSNNKHIEVNNIKDRGNSIKTLFIMIDSIMIQMKPTISTDRDMNK